MVLERIVGGIPWAIGSFLGPRAVTFISTVLLARFVLPAEFGTFALGLLVFIGAATLADPGAGAAMISGTGFGTGLQRAALTLMLGAGILAAAVVCGVAWAVYAWGSVETEPMLVIAAFAAVLPVHMFASFHDSLLQRDLRFQRRFVAQNVQAATFPAVALPMALAGHGVWALTAGHIAGTVLFGATAAWLSRTVRPSRDPAAMAEVLRRGIGFLTGSASNFLRSNVDYMAVGRWNGVTQLGFYSIAWRFAELPYLAVTEPVSRVLFAGMSHLRGTPTGVRDTYRGLLRFVAMLGCPVGVVLMVAADPFVEVVLGATWQPAAAVLAVLGMRSVLLPLNGMATWMLNGADRSRRIGALSGVMLVPFAVAVAVAAATGGIVAVAWVLLADAVVWSVLLIALAARWGVVGVRDHLTVLAPLAAATGVAAGCAWGALRLAGELSPLVELLVTAGVAATLFLATVLTLDRAGVRQSVALVRGRRHGGLTTRDTAA